MAAESRVRTPSGIPLEVSYAASGGAQEAPGEFPYVRGIHREMYRGRLWTMRQYSGFGDPRSTNARFRYLLAQGQTGLSVAFDLPTQIGYDSDDAPARGEVGKVGVPISTVEDLEELFEGISLDSVSVSMTINSSAAVLLAFLIACARRRGIPAASLRGTLQNDILKEFVARRTHRFPLRPVVPARPRPGGGAHPRAVRAKGGAKFRKHRPAPRQPQGGGAGFRKPD